MSHEVSPQRLVKQARCVPACAQTLNPISQTTQALNPAKPYARTCSARGVAAGLSTLTKALGMVD